MNRGSREGGRLLSPLGLRCGGGTAPLEPRVHRTPAFWHAAPDLSPPAEPISSARLPRRLGRGQLATVPMSGSASRSMKSSSNDGDRMGPGGENGRPARGACRAEREDPCARPSRHGLTDAFRRIAFWRGVLVECGGLTAGRAAAGDAWFNRTNRSAVTGQPAAMAQMICTSWRATLGGEPVTPEEWSAIRGSWTRRSSCRRRRGRPYLDRACGGDLELRSTGSGR